MVPCRASFVQGNTGVLRLCFHYPNKTYSLHTPLITGGYNSYFMPPATQN